MEEDKKIFDKAFRLYKEKKFKESLSLVNQLIDSNRINNELFFNELFLKGDLCHELCDYSEAVKVYTEILKYKKKDDDAFANRALAYWELNEYRKALKDYLHAVKINNNNALAYYGAGEMYLMLNKQKKAIFMLGRAIELRPGYEYSYVALGEVYYQLSKWGTAYEFFVKARELNADNELVIKRIEKIDNYFKEYEAKMEKTKGKYRMF